ncbi:MAG TPA: hypothetical protein VHV77_12510, partial [Pirellulales bacterium]|nr:hypothetical protein [Pirellulales bacterium]
MRQIKLIAISATLVTALTHSSTAMAQTVGCFNDIQQVGYAACGCNRCRPQCCRPGTCIPPGAVSEQPSEASQVPTEPGEEAQNSNAFGQAQQSPPSNNFASSLGAARGPQSAVPNMIGDAFGGSFERCQLNGGAAVVCPSIFTGGVVGQARLTENVSPIPRDRVYGNYSYF